MNTYHVYAICWKRILVKTERQGICYLCEEQGWAQGSFVEAEVEAEARQRQRARGRGEADKTRGKAEARQSEIDVVCVILISCTMHM